MNRVVRTAAELDIIADSQQQRSVLDGTCKGYINKCGVMTRMLNKMEDCIRTEALELDIDGTAISHTGEASNVLKLKLPMSVLTAKRLFAAISIDTSLPKKKKPRMNEEESEALTERLGDEDNLRNPAKNEQTVSAQTYQNYKSAIKWWHEFHNETTMGKTGFPWPSEVNNEVNKQIQAYKRDVGLKKRKGIIQQARRNVYLLIRFHQKFV